MRLNTAESEIAELKEDVSWKDRLIDQLRAEKQKFEDLYYKFRGYWHDIINRFQGMIGFEQDENYKQNEMLKMADSKLREIDEEYRATYVNMRNYGLVLLTTAMITELPLEEQNQITMYLCNNI